MAARQAVTLALSVRDSITRSDLLARANQLFKEADTADDTTNSFGGSWM